MHPPSIIRWATVVLIVSGLAALLSGCIYSLIPTVESSQTAEAGAEASPYTEDLVLVVFTLDAEFGNESLLDDMWPVEEQAMEALEAAGLGYIDGNDIGNSEYSLYFYGTDSGAMWQVLEPIMQNAPVPLSRVELWPPGESAEPTVIEFAPQP